MSDHKLLSSKYVVWIEECIAMYYQRNRQKKKKKKNGCEGTFAFLDNVVGITRYERHKSNKIFEYCQEVHNITLNEKKYFYSFNTTVCEVFELQMVNFNLILNKLLELPVPKRE